METQELTTRLETARKKASDVERERSRLTGESDSQKKQLAELEANCQRDFQCSIDELPDLIEKSEQEANKALSEAEVVLGLREAPTTMAQVSTVDTSVDTSEPVPTTSDDNEGDALPADEDALI